LRSPRRRGGRGFGGGGSPGLFDCSIECCQYILLKEISRRYVAYLTLIPNAPTR
jgi:hypothetical protein